jgi:carbamoyl-phosphate synthase L subunit-like protein
MNIVFFSPHFPPNMWLYCQRLAAQGATVLGIADAPYDSLRDELKDSLDGYYHVHDLHNYDDLIRALGWFTHRHGKIDRLESLNEYWLEQDAALRTEFNIPGIKSDSISRIKRKSAMKKVFEKAGIPVARGKAIRTDREARAFVNAVGYPVIAKPDIGVGAAKTYRIDDDAALAGFLSDRPTIDYFLEEWCEGQLLSYDGLADRQGKVVFEASITYGITVLEALGGPDMSYWLEREIPDDLRELGQRTAKAFDVRERPFHFEFFRMPDGEYRAIEVNMRQPGGYTVDMWNYQNDADVYRAWAQIMVHGTTDIENARRYAVLWAGRKKGRAYRLTYHQIARTYDHLLLQHLRVDDVFAAAMGHEGFVLRGPDLEPLRAAAAAIQEPA